jgi:hypothetical protein
MAAKIMVTGGGLVSATRAAYVSQAKISAPESGTRTFFSATESGIKQKSITTARGGSL